MVGICLAATGCTLAMVGAGAAAGAGAVAYSTGELKANLEATLDRSWDATVRTVKQLEFKVEESAKDGMFGRLKATTASQKTIQFKLNRVSDKLTELRIRVGTFGDEALSRSVYDKIKQGL